jgi:hypothetical protein
LKVPARLYWDLLTSWRYQLPTSLRSLFLKSERIPALLYVGKGPEYKPFFDLRPVPEAKWPPLWALLHFGKRPSVYCVL